MNDIELIKAFAEIEGIEVYMVLGCKGEWHTSKGSFPFNPITDLSLNCEVTDKYNVNISQTYKCVSVNGYPGSVVFFKDKSRLPRARIECIVKAHGGNGNE